MRRLRCLAAAVAVMLLSACAGTGQYPVSRAEAEPDDPVQELMLPILPWF